MLTARKYSCRDSRREYIGMPQTVFVAQRLQEKPVPTTNREIAAPTAMATSITIGPVRTGMPPIAPPLLPCRQQLSILWLEFISYHGHTACKACEMRDINGFHMGLG